MRHEIPMDGKIYALSKNYAAMCVKITEQINESPENFMKDEVINFHLQKMYWEYAEYLHKFDNGKVIELIKHILTKSTRITDFSFLFNDFDIIYRPAFMVSPLCLFCTLALKFKRLPNDNLGDDYES